MNPYVKESVSTSVWPEISYLANMISDNFWSIDKGHNPRHEIWNDPICLVRMYQNLLKCRRLRNQKQNTRSHQIRENGGSLDFNFILLLNSAVGENWVWWHRHLWKIMPCTMSRSIQILYEQQRIERFHFFVHGRLSFYYFHLVAFVSSIISALQVCALILSYAVCNFCITDAKYVMFAVGWCKYLKGSATPVNNISEF